MYCEKLVKKCIKSCILSPKFGEKNMTSSKRNYLNIETVTEAVEQQTRILRMERLNLAISNLMKKN